MQQVICPLIVIKYIPSGFSSTNSPTNLFLAHTLLYLLSKNGSTKLISSNNIPFNFEYDIRKKYKWNGRVIYNML